MKDFRLTAKLSNNLLIRARERAGFKSAKAFADMHGLNYGDYVAMENLGQSPVNKRGEWRPTAKAAADALGFEPHELWSDAVLAVGERPVSVAEIGIEDVRALAAGASMFQLPPGPEQVDAAMDVTAAMASLGGRHRAVVRHLALDGMTLEETGNELGLSRERVRQLYVRALSKMEAAMCGITKQMLFDQARAHHIETAINSGVDRRFAEASADLAVIDMKQKEGDEWGI